MELDSMINIRDRYRELLSGDAAYNDVLEDLVQKKETEPIFRPGFTNPEDDLGFGAEQRQLSEIMLDMHAINNGITEAKNKVNALLESLDSSLTTIQDNIKKQEEQINDLNVICGNESEYSAVIPVFASDFADTDAEILDEHTIGATAVEDAALLYDIVSISGNGYSGNSFVYKDGAFENETDDRSVIDYLMDENMTTVYEYSRLCTRSKQNAINGIINYDDKEAECTITLHAKQDACSLRIDTSDEDLIVRKLETSSDGITFITRLDKDLRFCDRKQAYQDASYIYGSSMLCFPYASYIRITFASDRILDETIAIKEEDGTVQIVPAYRKKIALNGLRLYHTDYEECVLTSREMLEGNAVDKISLFATEYIPDHFIDGTYIQYYLYINGTEYEVVPVNTGHTGIHIIKYSEESGTIDDSVRLVHETIKSVVLKIVIRPFQKKETPYVSNLKLCIGKVTGNIYV